MHSQLRPAFYATSAVIGLVATWWHNLKAGALTADFSLRQFISDNYVNHASASITNDIIVVAVVFSVWCFIESRRLGLRYWWAYIAATFAIALAFAFPLFLFFRERALQRAPASSR
ncbi:MAG: DUF2834 domain-containing protein [Pseudomonadota bacterium]